MGLWIILHVIKSTVSSYFLFPHFCLKSEFLKEFRRKKVRVVFVRLVPANKFLKTGRVPVNKFLKDGWVPANKILNTGGVPVNKFLKAGGVLENNLFL